ncbi:hypothetical protein YPPY36_4436, partial [Yersinia pestis PY-36]
MSNTVP